jgi:hypothetical protein
MVDALADTYRSYAEACFRIAQTTTDDAERARWIAMAQHWLQWAQEAEANMKENRNS